MDDVSYDPVFATWKQIEAQKEYDQYIIWIHPKTRLIAKVEYTIREANNWISGWARFENLQTVNGITLPTEMPVGSKMLKEGKLLHKMSIEEIDFWMK